MQIVSLFLLILIAPFFAFAFTENKIQVEMKNTGISGVSNYPIGISYIDAHPDKKDVILLIHANSSSKEFFESLMNQPALKNYRLIAIDLPGHGKSDKFPAAIEELIQKDDTKLFEYFDNFYTFPGYANVIQQFLKTLQIPISKVNVFGWSLGGHVAIDLLQKNPEMAKIILTGTPINDFDKTAAGFSFLKQLPAQQPFPKDLTVFDLLSYDKPFTSEQAQAFHQLVGIPPSEMTRKTGARTYPLARYFMVKFATDAKNHKPELSRANYQDQEKTVQENPNKFIVVQGQKDPIKIQGADADLIKNIGVKIHEIENAGHAAFFEEPEKVAEFMAEVFK